MKQYKVEIDGRAGSYYVVYKKVFYIFWSEVGSFYLISELDSVEEEARSFIKRTEAIYFEA